MLSTFSTPVSPYRSRIPNANLQFVAFSLQFLSGQHPNKSVPKPGINWCGIPEQASHEDIFKSLECWWLGNKRGACKDWLDTSSFHCFLQKFQSQCLCLVTWITLYLHLSQFCARQCLASSSTWCPGAQQTSMGATEVHDLQLLHWLETVPSGSPTWMQVIKMPLKKLDIKHPLIGSFFSKFVLND
jgi:hypothetical protein